MLPQNFSFSKVRPAPPPGLGLKQWMIDPNLFELKSACGLRMEHEASINFLRAFSSFRNEINRVMET